MQEAKYAEEITIAIKKDLADRGFVNEHDRLGHFESVVDSNAFAELKNAAQFTLGLLDGSAVQQVL